MPETIVILDYGSQYSQLIARRVREAGVFSELFPWDTPTVSILKLKPKGFILSGGPASVYAENAPILPAYILESGLPVLGICYGMQLLGHALGGIVKPSTSREYGSARIIVKHANPLLKEEDQAVWMSHGDRIEKVPDGFEVLASSANTPIAAFGDLKRSYFGLQFHPEVSHTPGGQEIIARFILNICFAKPVWTPDSIIDQGIRNIQAQVGNQSVLAAVSGGVDSAVATALVARAVGGQLSAVFVDNGLLRLNEREKVELGFRGSSGINLKTIDASDLFLDGLRGITDPEHKRSVIGEKFIRVFEKEAKKLGQPRFLVQGTIYPDVIESRAPERSQAHKIKTHHNVGGLPKEMHFDLVEPLRYLFKDEVRAVGALLGLPDWLVWRQPFPGPGLAVRCLGEVTRERLDRLRAVDAIFTQELEQAGWFGRKRMEARGAGSGQAFAVLLPVRSVGVMGDQRSHHEVVALRAVVTDDFMTADWARLPHELLALISSRITNEVAGVNRVVFDITTKPPATIEWE